MTMNEIVLAAGSVAGVFTAVAMDKVSQISSKEKHQNESVIRNDNKFDLERRIVSEAMKRVYDYEREGRITSVERQKLLARYEQHLNALNAKMVNLHFNTGDFNSFKTDLIALVDQRMSQINARLDHLADRMNNNGVHKPSMHQIEKKEEKPITENKIEQVVTVDTKETTESDASLDEIKKQIMQTLSRLEQAEVE